MKKYFISLLCAAISLGFFTACEDVPEPYNIPTENQNGQPVTPSGIEVTCAEAVELTKALSDGATSSEVYSITGYITEVVGEVSKNQQTFWMADVQNGGRIFEAYWANLPEGVTEFKAGSKVKITGKLTKYVNNNTGNMTAEIKNATVEILEQSDTPTPTPSGVEVTCAEAVELTKALADGATSTEVYSITGYITEVVGDVSRNQQTFWMADTKDGGRVFEAYWANLPEGITKFTKGMKVKITGQLMKYVNNSTGQMIPEIKNATVEILENGDTPTPTPSGTEVTCAQAAELANALENGATSDETYSVTGYITEVVGAVSRNQQTFWMADTKDGGKVFEAYYADLPEGISQFTKGMKVKITGKLMKYVNNSTGQVTPEIKNATVEILENGDTPTPTPTPTGTEVTCAQAAELANALANGATSDETYSVTGYITEVIGAVSRNQQTFWMADTKDGGRVFEAYYADLPEGISQFTVGMKVKITGKLLKYVNNSTGQVTPEIKNATVEILEGGDTPTPTPSGTKTLADFTNGNFETWADGVPALWMSSNTASTKGILSQSTDAHGGSYSVKVEGKSSANQRLASTELSLEAGDYNVVFYIKPEADGGSCRPGYVPVKDDGSVGSYVYGEYVNDLPAGQWSKVEYSFLLSAQTTVNLVIMNPKNPGKSFLIDDYSITKN